MASVRLFDMSLLEERKLDTLALRKRDLGVLASTDAENVAETGGERCTIGVLDVSDLVGTRVVLDVLEDTDTTDVIATSDKDIGAVFKFKDRVDVAGLQVKLQGIVDLDGGVGETDGSTVVSHDIGDLVLSKTLLGDLAQLVSGLLAVNSVGLEATLDVVQDTVVLARFRDGDDVHEAERVSVILP